MENCRIFFSDEVMFLVFSGEIKMWLKLLEGIYKFFIQIYACKTKWSN